MITENGREERKQVGCLFDARVTANLLQEAFPICPVLQMAEIQGVWTKLLQKQRVFIHPQG